MKKLLSSWSGSLLALLVPVVLIVSVLVPNSALAVMFLSGGGGGNNNMDGDPLDTNDYGGSGGGSVVHNSSAGGSPIPLVLEFEDIQVFMVSDVVGGKVIFRILVVERAEGNQVERSVEATHAR